MKYETLVISGGSTKGFGMLGILQELYENNIITNIENFIGCSVGGVIALFLSCGESPMSIFVRCASKTPVNISTAQRATYETVEIFLQERYENKNLTFLDLYQREKKLLVIPVYDIDRQLEIYHSYKISPDYKILDAVKETIKLPFILDGDRRIDGCFCTTFPIYYCQQTNLQKIIGIYVMGKYINILDNKNIYDDMLSLICQFLKKITILERALATKDDLIIELKSSTAKALSFSIDKDEAIDMFLEGYCIDKSYC